MLRILKSPLSMLSDGTTIMGDSVPDAMHSQIAHSTTSCVWSLLKTAEVREKQAPLNLGGSKDSRNTLGHCFTTGCSDESGEERFQLEDFQGSSHCGLLGNFQQCSD